MYTQYSPTKAKYAVERPSSNRRSAASEGTLTVCLRSGHCVARTPTSAAAAIAAISRSVVRQPNAAATKAPAGRPTAIASARLNMMMEIARPWRFGGCNATAVAAQVGATIATPRPQQQRASNMALKLVAIADVRAPMTNSARPTPNVILNDHRDVATASGMIEIA